MGTTDTPSTEAPAADVAPKDAPADLTVGSAAKTDTPLTGREAAEARRTQRKNERPAQRERSSVQSSPNSGAANRAASGDGNFVNQDVFENPDKKALTNLVTSVGADGIERVVQPATSGWQPAPMEATDEQKKAAEERQTLFGEAARQRQEAYSKPADTLDESDRLDNNPGNDGSQATPAE